MEHELLAAGAGDLVVPVGDVLLDGDRREGRRIDPVRDAIEDLGAWLGTEAVSIGKPVPRIWARALRG